MTNSSAFGIFGRRGKEQDLTPAQPRADGDSQTASPVTAPSLPSAATQLSKEQVAAISAQLSAAFGKIITVFMRAPTYRQMFLSDLEWLVAPAVATGQFSIAEMQDKASGLTVPVSAVLWATVSDAVDQRLVSNVGQPIRLKAQEWRSGSIPWLVAAAGEPRAVSGLLKTVAEKQFGASGIKTIARGADGKATVRILHKKAAAAASAAASN